ncbi:MAG: glycoside hydrolase family 6 protein, partial [Oligoflexales bacterium]|nr:glycoside hydrolase family 6 protein [Oligoflexales bacterium]
MIAKYLRQKRAISKSLRFFLTFLFSQALFSGCGSVMNGSDAPYQPSGNVSSTTNPFVGARFYINPEYVRNVEISQSGASDAMKEKMEKVKREPTAIWLDSISTIEGTPSKMGIESHLAEALKQQARDKNPGTPVLVTFVVYDLPDRDCSAFASNGELKIEKNGLQRYKREYIDKIYEKLTKRADYKMIRIVTVIEPDSLPNIVTNMSMPSCAAARDTYKEGVLYAVSKLSLIENVSIYIDTSHSGWLGWEYTSRAAQLYRELFASAGLMDR